MGLFTFCTSYKKELPKGYLTQEQLVPILVDIHLVEGARSGKLVLGDTNSLPDYYAKIYQKHNITQAKFKESFTWYSRHPEILKVVFEEVLVELSKKEASLGIKAETPEEDMLKVEDAEVFTDGKEE